MKKGFTLIELMVVITIMAIIMAVATVSYQKTIQLSRDSKRKTDLEQIRQALETYRSEKGTYPMGASVTTTTEDTLFTTPLTSGNYISSVPVDPKSASGSQYNYIKNGNAGQYSLCAQLEIDPVQTLSRCAGQACGSATGNCNYEVTNP